MGQGVVHRCDNSHNPSNFLKMKLQNDYEKNNYEMSPGLPKRICDYFSNVSQ